MKRRGFLTLLGAAIATPFAPAPVAARGAAYSKANLHAAIYIAKSRAAFSVWGLSQALGIKLEAAEALMGEMTQRGIVGPLQGGTRGGRWASSNILFRDKTALAAQARRARAIKSHSGPAAPPPPAPDPDLSRLLAYLRDLAQANGHTITSRAATA